MERGDSLHWKALGLDLDLENEARIAFEVGFREGDADVPDGCGVDHALVRRRQSAGDADEAGGDEDEDLLEGHCGCLVRCVVVTEVRELN